MKVSESNNIIKNVEEYASLFLTVDEIALLLDLDINDFKRQIRQGKSDIAKAYLKGKLQTTLDLRKQTKLFAEKGSPQAEKLMVEYQTKQKLSENG